MLETSKAFAKEFMRRQDIPTAAHAICVNLGEVREELRRFAVPVVVKASGLAAGKGVVICETHLQAEEAAAQMFSGVLLGTAEAEVILEEFLTGEELSFFALSDGTHAIEIASAQDHKRVGEGDTGPNTGAWVPTPLMASRLSHAPVASRQHRAKTVDGMKSRAPLLKGILFCGIMVTPARSHRP
jgi:phosphoribosylamine--glycine ligase